ncbi:MAG: 23S rRNA (adenine(2030)-N(6))-methyltransferase RlmJ [Geminicoccaceae bacterium]
MLSYRHGFHAGSPADVLKHAVFSFVLAYALGKPTPLYLLDTHAGAGGYDLGGAMAAKTGEARHGIDRVLTAAGPPELLRPYLDAVARYRVAAGADAYPGSPELARQALRETDRVELVELHVTDHAALAERFRGVANARVRRDDGLKVMLARLPPPQRRGIVLIDPSYEIKSDYEDVATALVRAHRRFANGVYLLWYPVIQRAASEHLLGLLRASGIRRQYRIELATRADSEGRGMTASGVVVINPPWTMPATAPAGLAWLARALEAKGPSVAGWLVPE